MKRLETVVRDIGIDERDKKLVIQTFREYKKLKHQSRADSDDSQYKEVQDQTFFDTYSSIYNSGPLTDDNNRRGLFVEALSKVVGLSPSTTYVNRLKYSGTNACIALLGLKKEGKKVEKDPEKDPIPNRALSLWANSFGHLKNSWAGKNIPEKLGRYLRISIEHLGNYHPSHEYVLQSINTRGAIFGIEDFMFDLAKENELDEKTASKYFTTLRKVPIRSREILEGIRKRIPKKKSQDVDNCLYSLLSKSRENKSSISSLISLLAHVDRYLPDQQSGEAILSYEPYLTSVIETDNNAMENLEKNTQEILAWGNFVESKGLLSHYLEVAETISRLEDDNSNKSSYRDLSTEIFKDYYRRNEDLPKHKDVQDKCYHAIESISSLELFPRSLAIDLTTSATKKLKRSIRLDREEFSLPLDSLVDIVVNSILINADKANDFLGYVIKYR